MKPNGVWVGASCENGVATCDVTVAEGCVLSIQADVDVRFDAGTGLVVEGALAGGGVDLRQMLTDLARPADEDLPAAALPQQELQQPLDVLQVGRRARSGRGVRAPPAPPGHGAAQPLDHAGC